MSLDSSILISHLAGDVHKEAVLATIEHLDTMGAELSLPLLCYAEVWTGVELLDEADQRRQAAEEIHNLLQASRDDCLQSILGTSSGCFLVWKC